MLRPCRGDMTEADYLLEKIREIKDGVYCNQTINKEKKMAIKTFYIKCTHMFKTKEAALTAGISPWDMWEVTKDDATDAVTMVAPVQVGPIVPPPNEGCELPCDGEKSEIHPTWREDRRRRDRHHRRKK